MRSLCKSENIESICSSFGLVMQENPDSDFEAMRLHWPLMLNEKPRQATKTTMPSLSCYLHKKAKSTLRNDFIFFKDVACRDKLEARKRSKGLKREENEEN